jgi:hypothetical protein
MSLPTPLWTLGAIGGLYIDEFSGNQPAVIGELHVLDSNNSTKHHSGSTGRVRRVGATLFDIPGTWLALLESYTEADTARNLTSDRGDEGNYYIKNVDWDRMQALNHSGCGVYRVNIELAEE